MELDKNTEGITPTAEFIASKHTGKFFEILPNIYMIKGSINDRGFEQAYAISNNRREFVLIDVVELASKEAVETLVRDGYNIKAILITGETVLKEAYADLATISQDAGGAEIYLHKEITSNLDFETRNISENDSLLSSFNLEIHKVPVKKKGAVTIYSTKNGGMLFTGDQAKGSAYEEDTFVFTREKQEKKEDEFELARDWQSFDNDFAYLFPRKGKPALEVDRATRSNILNWLSRGSS